MSSVFSYVIAYQITNKNNWWL